MLVITHREVVISSGDVVTEERRDGHHAVVM